MSIIYQNFHHHLHHRRLWFIAVHALIASVSLVSSLRIVIETMTIELRDHLGGSRGAVLRVLLVLGVEVVDRIGHDVPRIHRLPESGWGEDDDDENVECSSNLPEIVSSEKVGILFEVLPLGG